MKLYKLIHESVKYFQTSQSLSLLMEVTEGYVESEKGLYAVQPWTIATIASGKRSHVLSVPLFFGGPDGRILMTEDTEAWKTPLTAS